MQSKWDIEAPRITSSPLQYLFDYMIPSLLQFFTFVLTK